MYLNYEVRIPDVPGKINQVKKGKAIYVRYVVGRTYHPEKKYNVPDQRIIGKRSEKDPEKMIPNENYMKYFGSLEQPEEREETCRSSCVRIGTFLVIRKILENLRLPAVIEKYFGTKDGGLVADLVSVTDDQRIGLVNEWNESRDHREKIYISYDSTNKNCQAGDIEFVEHGHPKDDKGLPVFNYSIAYDTANKEPLFYEQYPGSIVDISQLQFMLEKAKGYGYKRVGFILDRGYFGKENIQYMDQCGYDFVIMIKGMGAFVKELILAKNVMGCRRNYRGFLISLDSPLWTMTHNDVNLVIKTVDKRKK